MDTTNGRNFTVTVARDVSTGQLHQSRDSASRGKAGFSDERFLSCKRVERALLLLPVLALALVFVLMPRVAVGQSSAPPAHRAFDIGVFWEEAFDLTYDPGLSSLHLGDVLPDNSVEVLPADPDENPSDTSALFPGGSYNSWTFWDLQWKSPEQFMIQYQEPGSSSMYDVAIDITFYSFSGTLTTTLQETFHLSGIATDVLVTFDNPNGTVVSMTLVAPNGQYDTLEEAEAAAEEFGLLTPPGADPPNFVPNETVGQADPDCAVQCENQYNLAVAAATNTYNTAVANCGGDNVLNGAAAGCTVYAVVWLPFSGPPLPPGVGPAICCAVAGIGGAIIDYVDCLSDARRSFANTVANAELAYVLCMEGCGYTIAYE